MISHGGKDIRYEDIVNLGTQKKSKNGTPNNFGSFKKIRKFEGIYSHLGNPSQFLEYNLGNFG